MFLRAKRPQRRRARKANSTPFINTAVFLFTLFNFGFVLFFLFIVVVASQHFLYFMHTQDTFILLKYCLNSLF